MESLPRSAKFDETVSLVANPPIADQHPLYLSIHPQTAGDHSKSGKCDKMALLNNIETVVQSDVIPWKMAINSPKFTEKIWARRHSKP